jgi:hypothetical protein
MNITALHLAAYGAGLAMTLVLASYLTPRTWWRRPTARGLAILAGGTWALGALQMHAFGPPVSANPLAGAAPLSLDVPGTRSAMAGQPPVAAARTGDDVPGQPFRVHRALNLRADPSTSAERLATVPAGALVTPTGKRRGDWWEIRAEAYGRQHTGWASSLWLRRKYE